LPTLFILLLCVISPPVLAGEPPSDTEPELPETDDCTFSVFCGDPYFPLNPGHQIILEGEDDGEAIEVLITALDQTHDVTFMENGNPRTVTTRIVEERENVDGELTEISRSYYAQCMETGDVYHFGETEDEYEDGVVIESEGWEAGVDDALPGVSIRGDFIIGDFYYQEFADEAQDQAFHVADGLTVTNSLGVITEVVRTLEADGLEPDNDEYTINEYAPGIGLIREDDLTITGLNYGITDGLPVGCTMTNIGNNPYFPLIVGHFIVLEGEEEDDGETEFKQLEFEVMNETHPVTVNIGGVSQVVMTRVVEERETIDGCLEEIARSYYAMCAETMDVYFFGEDLTAFEDGNAIDMVSSWLAGVGGAQPGIIMPGKFVVGATYLQANAPGVVEDTGMNAATGVTATVPLGTYENAVIVNDTNPLDSEVEIEPKTYAPGIGNISDDEGLQLVATNGVGDAAGHLIGSVRFNEWSNPEFDCGDAPDWSIPAEPYTVTLLDAAGNEVDETGTDDEGEFAFLGIEVGNYTVVATPPTPGNQAEVQAAVSVGPIDKSEVCLAYDPQNTRRATLGGCTFSTFCGEYFPLTPGHQVKLEGDDDGESIELWITALNQTKNITLNNGQMVTTRVVEEREHIDGELAEISRNWYARCEESGDIYHFGEESECYEDGVIVEMEDSWQAGVDGAEPGIIMPGTFIVGDQYFQEYLAGEEIDIGINAADNLTADTPIGSLSGVIQVDEIDPLEEEIDVSIRQYAPGVGIVRDDNLALVDFRLDGIPGLPNDCTMVTEGDNPYFPLVVGQLLVLEGEEEEDGEVEFKKLEFEVMEETRTFILNPAGPARMVETRVVEEREYLNGERYEISRNYYAMCAETKDVYYFGEDVQFFEDGEAIGTGGSWLAGENGAVPGLIMPGKFVVGASYLQENAPGIAEDTGMNAAANVTATVPFGTFPNSVIVNDTNPLEPDDVEPKIYAPGIGNIDDADGLQLVHFNGSGDIAGTISGSVYLDLANDGSTEGNNLAMLGQAGVDVILSDASGEINRVETDEEGGYFLFGVPPGNYTLTLDADSLNGNTSSISSRSVNLLNGQNAEQEDFPIAVTPTAVGLESFDALAADNGATILEWNIGWEADTLGYFLVDAEGNTLNEVLILSGAASYRYELGDGVTGLVELVELDNNLERHSLATVEFVPAAPLGEPTQTVPAVEEGPTLLTPDPAIRSYLVTGFETAPVAKTEDGRILKCELLETDSGFGLYFSPPPATGALAIE